MSDPTTPPTSATTGAAQPGTPDVAALAGLGQAVQAAGGIDGILDKLRAGGLGEAVGSRSRSFGLTTTPLTPPTMRGTQYGE